MWSESNLFYHLPSAFNVFLYFQLVKESVRKFQAKNDKQDQRQANIDLLRDNQKLEEQLKAQTKSWPQVWYTASHF